MATAADLLAIPEAERFHEVIDAELVRKASPSGPHAYAQVSLAAQISRPYDRRRGDEAPGGWRILVGVEVEFATHDVYWPDVVGWCRERLPELSDQIPITVRPDWVCEILSPSNAANDLVKKMRGYHRGGVPHYWIADPREETLTVYRWTAEGFLLVLAADREERVRAEPFEQVELFVGSLFGEDE
ncbi:MAG TPA: Uma2 family endonuclease [Enhygromyxa sp.]|nr:Uma2 family endonuclease [Enhygromyxa sp.]